MQGVSHAILRAYIVPRSQQMFSKILIVLLAIDSVVAATRTIYFRSVHDPNCGFLSFAPGVPKS